jgi:hypothetical protein
MMMRTLIVATALALGLLPVAAQAQWIDRGERAELRRDRADIRNEQRDLRYANRYGDRRDVRDAQREYDDAKREYRREYNEAQRDWRNPNYRLRYGSAHSLQSRLAYGNVRSISRGNRVFLVDRFGRVLDVRRRHWR